MRLDRLWIHDYKNLINATINFDEKNLTTVLIGRNGTAKSNLIEAIVRIFRNLDLREDPPFNYVLEYECNKYRIKIDADAGRSEKVLILVDGNPMKYNLFINDPTRRFLPRNVFGYYSGTKKRLEEYFNKHQDKFYYELLNWMSGEKPPLRPLFYARTVHSQYVLLAFFSFEEEYSSEFLKDYFGITGFDKAEFELKEPKWYDETKNAKDFFWGARGVVRAFLDDLASCSLPPIRTTERVPVSIGKKKKKKEEHIHLRIKDLDSLRRLASGYKNNVDFFKTLESTYISDLIHELRIQVKKVGMKESLEFSELSEGEQQLLTVLGLLKFTKEEESLFLLDEPDTHLNPAWKLEYIDLLQKVVGENEHSHVLIVTHDPLLVGGLKKEQVQIFFFKDQERHIAVDIPDEDPIGMGVAGLLTSELFGLPAAVDLKTQAKLDRKRELAVKEKLSTDEKLELEGLDAELAKMGFLSAFRDPLYSKFLKAARQYDQLKKPVFTPGERKEQAELARKIVAELKKDET